MFCSTCGIDSVDGLKYCKRCGAIITTAPNPSSGKPSTALTLSFLALIGAVFAMGLALPMAAAHDLVQNGFSPRDLMMLFAADLSVTLIVVAMLIWLFLRLSRPHRQTIDSKGQDILQHNTVQARISAPQPIISVTENTTRSFPRRFDD